MNAEPMVFTIGEMPTNGGIPNVTVENTRFYGRPNFAGILNQFNDDSRQFTIRIPEEAVEPLRALGYNVKTKIPQPGEDVDPNELEVIHHLKVKVDIRRKKLPEELNADVWIKFNGEVEKLTLETVGIIDRSRFYSIDIEFRGWEYDKDENPGAYSARLVQFVGEMEFNRIAQKHGGLM